MLDETCPECGAHKLQRRVGRFGPFVGCSGYPDCTYIKKDPPKTIGVGCPQCKQGELIEKRSRFGTTFFSCNRYPDCDFAAGNQPDAEHPCPECGSLLLRRPKSLRCWNCGAELDLEYHVTKSGDVEEEAASRAAKASAKAARAAAKAKRAPAKKKTASKKDGDRKKETASKKKKSVKKKSVKKPAVKKPAVKKVAAAGEGTPDAPAPAESVPAEG
jgi:DNA topoisomerase-1